MPVAVVTGSTRGIGRAVAARLVKAGYAVALNGRSDEKAAAREMGGDTLVVRADVATAEGAKALIDAALKKWGRIDVLVNNVGDFDFTPVSKMELDRWDYFMRSNLYSAWYVTRAALPSMRAAGRGVIVNIGGTAMTALRAAPNAVACAMAKAALVIFSKSLAQAEAPNGLRVNVVNPGFIRTEAYGDADAAALAPKVPMGAMGEPDDIAKAVEFLASDNARYVTGAVLDVGGGLWV